MYDFSSKYGEKLNICSFDSKSNGNVDREVLYGTDLRHTSAPSETLSNNALIKLYDKNNKGFGMNQDLISKHLLLLGGIGSGKTNVFNFIIQSLLEKMTNEDVMIIFDTKGDFKNKFYEEDNKNHLLIGNNSKYFNCSRYWNIFDELKNDKGKFDKESELIAKEISKQLFVGRESETQPFFSQAAADLISKVLIHKMRYATRNHSEKYLSTKDFMSFAQTGDIKKYYDMINDPANLDFVNAQSYFGNPNDRMTAQALGVFSNINTMINDLFVGIFSEERPTGSFSMKNIIQQKGKKIVFVEYDLAMGETLGPMYRLIFDLALREALGGRQNKRGNTYLIIDEFKLLPELLHIEDALNYGRSLGVKIFAGLQSINQLYEIYGEYRGKVLAAGFMNSFCFQTLDLDSRAFIKERFGEIYEELTFRSNTTSIHTQREGNVVEDWDIMKLKPGQAFINLIGYKPFFFEFKLFD